MAIFLLLGLEVLTEGGPHRELESEAPACRLLSDG